MANALAMQLEQPGNYDELSVEQRLQLLTDAEQLDRDQRKQRRLLKAAKLKLHATGQDIDYHHPRGLQQAKMASLLQCQWLHKAQNLLLTGPCGSGKTYLACDLAHTACMKGYSVNTIVYQGLCWPCAKPKRTVPIAKSYSSWLNSKC